MKKNKFTIPNNFLKLLDEYSAGGYALFTFDVDGSPIITSKFDSFQNSIAMQYFISQYIKAMDNSNLLNMSYSIHQKKKN